MYSKLRPISRGRRQHWPFLDIMRMPCSLLATTYYNIILLSNLLTMRVPDEGYSRNMLCSCALHYIATFLLDNHFVDNIFLVISSRISQPNFMQQSIRPLNVLCYMYIKNYFAICSSAFRMVEIILHINKKLKNVPRYYI